MTLPNRVGYVSYQPRALAPHKVARGGAQGHEVKPTDSSDSSGDDDSDMETAPRATPYPQSGIAALRPGLWSMLAGGLSPAQTKREVARAPEFTVTSPVSGPESVVHRKALALASRHRLEQDPRFEDVWGRVSMRGLLEGKDAGANTSDAFDAVLEQLPDLAVDSRDLAADAKRTGLGSCLDGLLVDDAGSLRATFERAARRLCEWSKRRMALTSENVPDPPQSTSPTEMLREGVLVERAAREVAVHEDAGGSSSMAPTLASYGFDLSVRGGAPKRRANLNKTAKELLRVWFEAHVHHPYPTEEEKEWLANQGGITLEQVNNWFINTRGRKWKPMLKRLMAEKQKGECKLLDDMVQRMTEPYHRDA